METKESNRLQKLERENQRLRRAVDELSVLNELSREIGASLDAGEIMSRIIKRSLKALGAAHGVVTLVDEEQREPMRTLLRTRSDSAEDLTFHLDEAVLGWMLLNRQPLVVNDPGFDKRFAGVRWHEQIRNVISAPLMVRSRLIGAITLYNKKGGSGFSEDDRRLLAIIATQSAQIVENARLYEEERAFLHIREELRLAAEIQQKLLPDEAPRLPGYELAGRSIPAQSVGGDYYDYLILESEQVAICVADVSGKGLPAALLMANVQATLRASADAHGSAAECLMALNRLLHRSMRRGTFVTLVYGILDVDAHSVDLANAGHNRPLICRADGTIDRIETAGFPAGVMAEVTLPSQSIHMEKGDVLFLYSDGVSEARNAEHMEFGEHRLIETLRSMRTDSAEDIVSNVIHAVSSHVGDADPHDDITLSVLKRRD